MLPFETERLVVRPLTGGDRPALMSILTDGEVMKLALMGRPFKEDEARRYIDEEFATNATEVTKLAVVCLRSSGETIGFTGIFPCPYLPGELEFGFVLASHAHGQGFATEIGRKLLDIGFRDLGAARLYALCSPRNIASREVLSRKLQMTFVKDIETPDRGPRAVFERLRDSVTDLP